MKTKEAEKWYQNIKKIAEAKVLRYQKEGRCLGCEKVFTDKNEFKILVNPITKEEKKSAYCNVCRPKNTKKFKEWIQKGGRCIKEKECPQLKQLRQD